MNPAIGLKRRGAKGRVELKVLMDEGKGEEDGDIKGIEHWKKYKASVRRCHFSLTLMTKYADITSSFFFSTRPLFFLTQIGKGLAEEESLAQVHTLLEVREGKREGTILNLCNSHPTSLLFFSPSLFPYQTHGLIDNHVTSLLASEDGTKSVEVAKVCFSSSFLRFSLIALSLTESIFSRCFSSLSPSFPFSLLILPSKAACREDLRRTWRPRGGLPGRGRGQAVQELRRGGDERKGEGLPVLPRGGEEDVRAGDEGGGGDPARVSGLCLPVCVPLDEVTRFRR